MMQIDTMKTFAGKPSTEQNALGYLQLDSSCQHAIGGYKYTFVKPWLSGIPTAGWNLYNLPGEDVGGGPASAQMAF